MTTFSGFPSGRLDYTRLPSLVFSELLPAIDTLVELKVTLHVFWLISHSKGRPQYVTLRQLLEDATLLRGLQNTGPETRLSPAPSVSCNLATGQAATASAEEALREGLLRAVTRGTLLYLVSQDEAEHFYFLNDAQGRQIFERALVGEMVLSGSGVTTEPALAQQRPNIFVLYEQNIGLLQPIIAEELKDAEETYPQEWIEEAFRIAAEQNARSWKYVQKILERWSSEGKGKTREKTWYTEEESRRFIKR